MVSSSVLGSQYNHHYHKESHKILVTTPAPTVRPPSRTAKRSPSFIATGEISSAFTCQQHVILRHLGMGQHLDIIPWQHHLHIRRQLHHPCHISSPEIKLWSISVSQVPFSTTPAALGFTLYQTVCAVRLLP